MPHIFGYDLPEEQAVAAVLGVFRARGAVEALLALKDEGLIDPAAQREMGIVNAAPFCGEFWPPSVKHQVRPYAGFWHSTG